MKIKFTLFLLILSLPSFVLGEDLERIYLLLERSKQTESGLRISTIGTLGFGNEKYAHLNLSYVESRSNGRAGVMDVAVGVSYKMIGTFFAGGGYMFGYNPGKSDLLSAFYPEAGIAAEFSRKFSVVVSGRRIFNIYDQNENVILFGLLFGDL